MMALRDALHQRYIKDGIIRLVPVKGTHNAANFLTKAVCGEAFARDRAYAMGIH